MRNRLCVLIAISIWFAHGIDVNSIVAELISYPVNRIESSTKSNCFDPIGRAINSPSCTIIYQYCNGTWLKAYKLDTDVKNYINETTWCWPDYREYMQKFEADAPEFCKRHVVATRNMLKGQQQPSLLYMTKLTRDLFPVFNIDANGSAVMLSVDYAAFTKCNHTYIIGYFDDNAVGFCATLYADVEYNEEGIAEHLNGSCYDSDVRSVVSTRSAVCVAKYVVKPGVTQIDLADVYAKSKLNIDFNHDKYCREQTEDTKCYETRRMGELSCQCCCFTSADEPCNDIQRNRELREALEHCAKGFGNPDIQDQLLLPYLFSPQYTAYSSNVLVEEPTLAALYNGYDTVMDYMTIRIRDRVVLDRGILFYHNSSYSMTQTSMKFTYLCNYNVNYINFGSANCKCALDTTGRAGNRSLDCCCRPDSMDKLLFVISGLYREHVPKVFEEELQPAGLAYRETTPLYKYLIALQKKILNMD
ncbi:unnamed protein product [Bursaphelenchus okinawaensis]|uniref:Uncharacterized protein n=1 Tax=Bursaphelenchus okinawaensis TaxID=465554 RepID=A0A811KXR3_9BILA|nr:unnamed protein product [Bursaphelenchus okinawaensis]CAG9113407.1 unnamed protein product [Bursaphelenchus okinawaensis]